MITKILLTDFNGNIYELPTSSIKLSKYETNKASCLEIQVISRDLYVSQGDKLSLYTDGNLQFIGTIFSFSANYDSMSITAYDNLIYFKSNDTLMIKNQTASNILKDICYKIGIDSFEISDTAYVIPYYLFENTSYFSIIEDILSSTKLVSNEQFILLDSLGTITLKPKGTNNKTFQIDDNLILYIYSSTSVSDIYNTILVYQISETGEISKYYAYDYDSIARLGQMQKSVLVDRNLSVAQCNLIAENTLDEYKNATYSTEIDIIALEIINIHDILIINDKHYEVIESCLTINSSSETYSLTLQNEVI